MEPGAVNKRRRDQEKRDRARAVADHGEDAAAALAPPSQPSEAAGLTAASRAAAFSKPGRSESANAQAAERQVRRITSEIKRQAKKDPLKAAAALKRRAE